MSLAGLKVQGSMVITLRQTGWSSSPGRSAEMVDEVKHGRCRQKQAVDPVEHAAMARNENSRALDSDIPLDRGDRQVAQLARDADQQTQHHTLQRLGELVRP